MMEFEWRYCSEITRSLPKSWMEASGSRMSWRRRDIKSPPTQYSKMSHKWLLVSYLQTVFLSEEVSRTSLDCFERSVLCSAKYDMRGGGEGGNVKRANDSKNRGSRHRRCVPRVELQNVVVVQGMHCPNLLKRG